MTVGPAAPADLPMKRIPDWLKAKLSATHTDVLRIVRWARRAGPFYAGSAAAHVLAVIVVLSWTIRDTPVPEHDAPDEIDTEIKEGEVARFVIGTPPVRLSELSARSLAMVEPPSQTEKKFDDTPLYEDAGGGTRQTTVEPALGGLGGFVADDKSTTRASLMPEHGIGVGLGGGDRAGSGGWAEGFNGAGRGSRNQMSGSIDDQETERAVAGALNWLRRHQHEDGSWSLSGYAVHCREQTCQGACDTQDDVLATALAVLPFLAAGQTHISPGIYQTSQLRAIEWLLAHETSEGGLAATTSGSETQAIATLCLCEAYSLSGDLRVQEAAQRALQFMERNSLSSMEGWQWAAVASADRAGLTIGEATRSEAVAWMAAKSSEVSPFASADWQNGLKMDGNLLGLRPVVTPLSYFDISSSELPTAEEVIQSFLSMANLSHDAWNRQHEAARRRLLTSQAKSGCATGSWPAENDQADWLPRQGRLPSTCFAALLLAAAYRQLPIHRTNVLPVARRLEHSESAGGR